MNKEIRALEKNETCEIKDLLANKNPTRCKRVFTVKYIHVGVDKLKVKLVAKGFTQSYRIDYKGHLLLLQNSIQSKSSSPWQQTLIGPYHQLDI